MRVSVAAVAWLHAPAVPVPPATLIGIHSFQAGAGPFGAIVVGFVMGGFTLVVGRYDFSIARSPAACAGYDVTLALANLGIREE